LRRKIKKKEEEIASQKNQYLLCIELAKKDFKEKKKAQGDRAEKIG